jgi:hypothetical protein
LPRGWVDEPRVGGEVPVLPGLVGADPAVLWAGAGVEHVVEGDDRGIQVVEIAAFEHGLVAGSDEDVVGQPGRLVEPVGEHRRAAGGGVVGNGVVDGVRSRFPGRNKPVDPASSGCAVPHDDVVGDQRVRGVAKRDPAAAPAGLGRVAAYHVAGDGRRAGRKQGDPTAISGRGRSVSRNRVAQDVRGARTEEENPAAAGPAAAVRPVVGDDVVADRGRGELCLDPAAETAEVAGDPVAFDQCRAAGGPHGTRRTVAATAVGAASGARTMADVSRNSTSKRMPGPATFMAPPPPGGVGAWSAMPMLRRAITAHKGGSSLSAPMGARAGAGEHGTA